MRFISEKMLTVSKGGVTTTLLNKEGNITGNTRFILLIRT